MTGRPRGETVARGLLERTIESPEEVELSCVRSHEGDGPAGLFPRLEQRRDGLEVVAACEWTCPRDMDGDEQQRTGEAQRDHLSPAFLDEGEQKRSGQQGRSPAGGHFAQPLR